ncbi:triose-phosphate transporter family-domain-containing protein [Zychaea mexicana]|uniref:triose-phosphate transporter family-domain-containing protein n=1 Tax=Zychaea mexicana TaxID=64656 RepID=UPI0022FEA68C|nr:triose-phosphate transporter family-domain-containing protein [Zychaea mexicana]KAI9490341.1 triose-phosphate transporter family-domain-containing protein [Zychaea mexicana]
MVHAAAASLDDATATHDSAMEHRPSSKTDPTGPAHSPVESDAYTFQDDDDDDDDDGRLSQPSERLLQQEQPTRTSDGGSIRKRLSPQSIALLKTSGINVLWILTWYLFATFLSVYNKWMFSAEHYNFQFPLFVSSIHMVVQFIFSGLSILLVPRLRPTKRPTVREYIFKVLPCALATSLDIGLSNLSLKTITLSFYTMCKSSTLAFVLLFAFLFRLEKPSLKLICIILIIITGVILMVSDETEFELVGFICVMTASACGGLRWALTELLLRKESIGLSNPFASIFFLAPAQAVILIVLSAPIEGYPTIFRSAFFVTFGEGIHTTGIILVGGCLAFCMIMAEFFLIKRTSVVTLSVCGIFKEVATIFISTLVFGDVLTIVNTIGLCITLFGIGLYNWLKLRRATRQAHKDVRDQELEGALDTEAISDREHRRHHHHPREPMYSMVAESTPMLLVDGAMSSYRDSTDSNDLINDGDNGKHQHARGEQYELR